jgi:subtilisin family serine protease
VVTDNKVGVAGLLWEGTVLVVKTTDSHGQSSSLTLRSGVREAIALARERNMRLVINYSAGGVDNHTKRAAIEEAGKADAVFVAAAGNKNGNPIGYPAAYSQTLNHVITVGAVDRELQAAKFSSSGPQMNVVAPGVDILSTMPNYHVRANNEGFHPKYDLMSGTSMAAPFVAALAALIRAKYPDFSAEQVRDRMEETAQSLSPQSADWVGKGLIDVEQALL